MVASGCVPVITVVLDIVLELSVVNRLLCQNRSIGDIEDDGVGYLSL